MANNCPATLKMLKLILLPLLIAAIPSGLVIARFTYKRLELALEARRLELDSQRDDLLRKQLKD